MDAGDKEALRAASGSIPGSENWNEKADLNDSGGITGRDMRDLRDIMAALLRIENTYSKDGVSELIKESEIMERKGIESQLELKRKDVQTVPQMADQPKEAIPLQKKQ